MDTYFIICFSEIFLDGGGEGGMDTAARECNYIPRLSLSLSLYFSWNCFPPCELKLCASVLLYYAPGRKKTNDPHLLSHRQLSR